MKLNDINYCCSITTINKTIDMGLDNIHLIEAMGLTIITNKQTKEGDVVALFQSGSRLSDNYCYENNLYRDSSLNKNKEEKGYIERNRTIRSMKMRGKISNGMVMPISSFEYVGYSIGLKKGDAFNELNGEEIVSKPKEKIKKTEYAKGVKKKIYQNIHNHYETPNLMWIEDKFEKKFVYLSQKLHGTSCRIGLVNVKEKLSRLQRVFVFLGFKPQTIEKMQYFSGSKRVLRRLGSVNNIESVDVTKLNGGWYSKDLQTETLKRHYKKLEEGYTYYGEIIGRDGEKRIQPKYSYNQKKGEHDFYVYRITENIGGGIRELTQSEVVAHCLFVGLKQAPNLWSGKYEDIPRDSLVNKRYSEKIKGAIPLSDKDTVDEGFVIKTEDSLTYAKLKCSEFLLYENGK